MTRDLCASHVRKVRGVLSALAAVLACVGLCVPSAVASDGVDWRVMDGRARRMGVGYHRQGREGRRA